MENNDQGSYSFQEHFNEMCRACMSLKCDSAFSFHIDETKKMFTACTSLEIESSDGLPDQICSSCNEQLNLWNNFKNQCIEADSKLRQMYLAELSYNLLKAPSKNYKNGKREPDETITDNSEVFAAEMFDCDEPTEQDSDSVTPLNALILRPIKKKTKKARLKHKLTMKRKYERSLCINSNDKHKINTKDKKKIMFNVLPGEEVEVNDYGEAVKIKCNLCSKHFYLSENLKEHMKVHEGKTIPECDICNRQFKSIESLRCHKLSHADVKKHTCKICGKSFLFNYVLTHHMGTHSGEKTIPCDQCGKTFRTKALLETHMQVHSEETPYSCEICNKKFKRHYGLKIHLIRCKGEKNVTCVECGKSFAINADLKIHLRSHTGEKPFPCDFCGKKFRTHSHMTLHRRNHTGDRPHACSSCPMKFMTKKSLAMHFLIHTGELPHACSICSRPFRQKSALRTHMKTHNIASSDITMITEKS